MAGIEHDPDRPATVAGRNAYYLELVDRAEQE
jgi:hypothetical protein